MKVRTIGSVIASLLAMLAFTGAAQAALPGVDGKIAFMSLQDGDYDVYTVDSAGAGLAQLTNNPATDGDPAWSPDGSTIAFATNRDGNYEIYTMSATGSNLQRLTTNTAADGQPSWSPTGTQIVFGSDRDGNFEIYTMNSNGTGQTRLTTNTVEDSYPAWSPDGAQIAFQRGPTFEIYTMNSNGSSQVNRTNAAGHDTAPNWSPNGSTIAFVATRTGGGDIYTMNANGTNQALAKGNAASDNSPVYSPQGTQLAWAQNSGGTSYDLVKGNAAILNTQSPLYSSGAADESPDWQPLNSSYARPKGASPLILPLVPAYKECTAPQTTHRTLGNQACYVPKAESNWLQVGTPDYNGAAANSVASVRMAVFCNGGNPGDTPPCLGTPGEQLDGKIEVSVTDVRCRAVSTGCSAANADYTGEVGLFPGFRVTDKNNGPTGVGPSANATTQRVGVGFGFPCTATVSTTIGSTCSVTTSIDAVLGSNTSVSEAKRGIWQLDGEMVLFDGGIDGNINTFNNTVFMVGGLFFP